MQTMTDVTRLLNAAEAGDSAAIQELIPLVYGELRRMAAIRMEREREGHSLDPTSLVHEAFLRLVGDRQFDNQGQFFIAAAEAMRRVLVNNARRNRRRNRPGRERVRIDLDRLTDIAHASDEEVVELNDALSRLEQRHPTPVALVKMRFFAGMTLGEAARILGIPRRTADRHWLFARAWLADALSAG